MPNDPNNAGKHNETSLNLICITTETDYCVSIVTWFFDEFFFLGALIRSLTLLARPLCTLYLSLKRSQEEEEKKKPQRMRVLWEI